MNTTPNVDDTAPIGGPNTRVSVGDIEIDRQLLTGPGALFWWLVQQLTGTTLTWQTPTEPEDTFPRGGWRLIHPPQPCTPADRHQPVTLVLAAPAPPLLHTQDNDDLWVQVQLTGYPGEPDPCWRATRIGTHHRVRPTQHDQTHGDKPH